MLDILKEWVPVLLMLMALGACSGAWLAAGKAAAIMRIQSKRLDDHSEDIQHHTVLLARLDGLPEQVRTAEDNRREDSSEMRARLDDIYRMLVERRGP